MLSKSWYRDQLVSVVVIVCKCLQNLKLCSFYLLELNELLQKPNQRYVLREFEETIKLHGNSYSMFKWEAIILNSLSWFTLTWNFSLSACLGATFWSNFRMIIWYVFDVLSTSFTIVIAFGSIFNLTVCERRIYCVCMCVGDWSCGPSGLRPIVLLDVSFWTKSINSS